MKGEYMAFDDVRYVEEFPTTFQLDEPQHILEDVIGVMDIKVIDSIMLVATSEVIGMWKFYSLPTYRYLGKFLNQGNGPTEFLFTPFLSHSTFICEDFSLTAYIRDNQRGDVISMDIGKSIKNQKLEYTKLDINIPNSVLVSTTIDNNKFFIKEISNDFTQQVRYVIDGGVKDTLEIFSALNGARVSPGEDHNILAGAIAYSHSKQLILEMPAMLNYLNLYNLDGSFTKTICYGDKMMSIGGIEQVMEFDRIQTFRGYALFDNFFGVMWGGNTELEEQKMIGKPRSILLFDWEGNPLAEIKINDKYATSFDIDLINGRLYTSSYHSDELLCYDVTDVLAALKL
jgi:hypothetical protein